MMFEVLTSEGSIGISGLEYGLPSLIRAPDTLRNLTMAIKPFLSPIESWSHVVLIPG